MLFKQWSTLLSESLENASLGDAMQAGQRTLRLVYLSDDAGPPSNRSLCNPLRLLASGTTQIVEAGVSFLRDTAAVRNATALRDSADAIVIGGGVFGIASTDEYIEFWRGARVPLILWAAGLGAHPGILPESAPPQLEDYHQLPGFSLFGLRDSGFGLRWVPCSSCMSPHFDQTLRQGQGVIVVVDHNVRSLSQLDLQARRQNPSVSVVYDDLPAEVLIDRLRQAEFVVTNSYIAAYWATLLGKRVVAADANRALSLFKHPLATAGAFDWQERFDQALSYPDALDECRQANSDFRREVSELVANAVGRRPYHRNPIAEHAHDPSETLRAPARTHNLAPRVVHFIFGLKSDFGGKPFNVVHKIAILSAVDRIKPEEVFFHYRHMPKGTTFESVRSAMTLVKLPAVADQAPVHFAHQSDVIRLRKLFDDGGIYLDLDTIAVSSFDSYLANPLTIGVQGLSRIDGLCNAVMIAKPRSQFIRDWLDTYSRFTAHWDRFSVRLPYVMWRSGRADLHVEPYDAFHWPTWRSGGLVALFERDFAFPNAKCHHLWESQSFPRYFASKSDEQIAQWIKGGGTTYGRLARSYVD